MKVIKRLALVLLLLLIVVVGAFGSVMYSTFHGRVPQTADALKDGAVPIVDGYVNAFAIPLTDPGKVALIDCGNDKEATAIQKTLDAHHWTVAAIFITHGHPDHVNGCPKFKGVPLYALQAEVDVIEGRAGTKGPLPSMMGPQDIGLKVTNPLKDGDDVDVDGVRIHVYAVPGHTAGSAVYRARNTLFFGDTATAKEPNIIVGPPWVFSDDAKAGGDSLGGLASKLYAEKGIDTFAFAHSGPLPADLEKLWVNGKKE